MRTIAGKATEPRQTAKPLPNPTPDPDPLGSGIPEHVKRPEMNKPTTVSAERRKELKRRRKAIKRRLRSHPRGCENG